MRIPLSLAILALLASAAPASAVGGCVVAVGACAFVEPWADGATGATLVLTGPAQAEVSVGCRQTEWAWPPDAEADACSVSLDGAPLATVTIVRWRTPNGQDCAAAFRDDVYMGTVCGPNPEVSENPDRGAPCVAYAPGSIQVCLGMRERAADCGGRPGVEYGVAYGPALAGPGYVPVACVAA